MLVLAEMCFYLHAADFPHAFPAPIFSFARVVTQLLARYISDLSSCKGLACRSWAVAFFMNAACTPISAKTLTDQCLKMLQGGYPQPGAMPVGYAPYPYAMMPGYPPAPAPVGKAGKAAAGAEPATKGRKRRKRIPQGGPKKPATSFVLFSNTVREQVKEENPGLSFLDLGKKLGEMWREMDPNVRCSLVP